MSEDGNKKKKFNYDYPVVGFLYLWAIVFLIATTGIEDEGAKLFPYIVIALSIFLATILLLKNLLNIGTRESYDFSGTVRAIKMTGMLVLFVIAVTFAGFYFTTPFFLYFSMLMLGQRNQKVMVLTSLLVPLFTFLLFDYMLGLRIPNGAWFD